MIGTFFYYLVRTSRNRAVSALKRLRQPKYLISALAGLGYLYLVFFRQFLSHPKAARGMPVPLDVDVIPLVETGLALVLLVLVLLPWIWPGRGREGLRFTEAEIQFLFPAPILRRTLIHFRLIRMQLSILFGVLISLVVFGRGRFLDHPIYAMVALWLVYSFLALYYMGTNLTQMSLAEHGVSGFKRQFWTLTLLAVVVVSIGVWLKWFIPPLPATETAGLSDFSAWFVRTTGSGPAYYLLLPFQALVRPAFSPDAAAFLLRLFPALGVLFLAYLWVMRTDVSFEEASLEKARRMAIRLEAARSGNWRRARRAAPKARRPPFQLAPVGFAHTAIFWKNLISAGRLAALRVLPVVVMLVIVLTTMTLRQGSRHELLPMVIGSVAVAMAGALVLIGPIAVRDDLRNDLLQIDLLKTYPISGWGVVLGEVLAPTAILAVMEWLLVLVAALVLPSLGKIHPTVSQRLLVGLSAAFLLPCFSLIGVVLQNAFALLWPGWVELGKSRRQGIEAMGQRLITMVATVLAFVLADIPAGLVFAAVFFLGFWLLGLTVLPIAALVAALVLLGEAGLAIFWLGRLYDKFDVSLEGPGR
jgi:hypothetical protein